MYEISYKQSNHRGKPPIPKGPSVPEDTDNLKSPISRRPTSLSNPDLFRYKTPSQKQEETPLIEDQQQQA